MASISRFPAVILIPKQGIFRTFIDSVVEYRLVVVVLGASNSEDIFKKRSKRAALSHSHFYEN